MPHRRKDLNIAGPNLWYLVGLITTDGCLSSDGRHINITSKDEKYLIKLKNELGLNNKIRAKNEGRSMDRKAKLANECCLSYEGWSKSKTVLN